MSEDFMKDFDALAPPKRIAKIGGEEIDVSFVPARTALKFIDFSKKYDMNALKNGGTEAFGSGMLEGMLDIIEAICARSSKKITTAWLLDNVEMSVLMQFVEYVFEGVKKTNTPESSGETGKN